MKNYQKPFVGTVINENLFFRCQATANCNANIDSCNGGVVSAPDGNTTPAIVIGDCQFTACFEDGFVPTTSGSLTFDCGSGTGPFTADFVTVTPAGVTCENTFQIPFTIVVDVTPALPDTCNGGNIIYVSGSGNTLNCAAGG